MDPFLGEIRTFPWAFAPRNWALCNGAILPITQYQALFALLGTTYGGNGTQTFGLPDLRGRTPLHVGTPAGGPTYPQGELGGAEAVTLSVTTLPAHNHMMYALAGTAGNNGNAGSSLPAKVGAAGTSPTINIYASSGTQVPLASTSLSSVGGGQPHNNMQPFLVLNFCIAMQGLFPPRN